MSFEARYWGTCGSCGDEIEPGDEVTYDDGELVHDQCSAARTPVRRGRGRAPVAVAVRPVPKIRVCSRCHQEIPLALGRCENCT